MLGLLRVGSIEETDGWEILEDFRKLRVLVSSVVEKNQSIVVIEGVSPDPR